MMMTSFCFFKASQQACSSVTNVLVKYCMLAGQEINRNKSLVVFSPNTPRNFRIFMARTLGVKHACNLGKYLRVYVDGRDHVKKSAVELVDSLIVGCRDGKLLYFLRQVDARS